MTSYGRGVTELIIIMMRRTREVVSKEVGEEESLRLGATSVEHDVEIDPHWQLPSLRT